MLGRHVDAVRRAGQVIFPPAGSAQIGDDGFAGLLELQNIFADFLHLRPSDIEAARLKDDAFNARIRRGFVKRLPDFLNRDGTLRLEERQRNLGRGFLRNFAFQLQHQRGSIGNGYGSFGERAGEPHHSEDQDQRGQPRQNDPYHQSNEEILHDPPQPPATRRFYNGKVSWPARATVSSPATSRPV